MRTRLKDVAEKLKLSPALVSGVLNDRPNVWASEETRTRIIEAARELNYHPSAAAQALSRGSTQTVAFVYRRLDGFAYRLAYTGLVDVLSAELQDMGYDLNVSNFSTEEEVLNHLRKLANARACDAVILWGREADTEAQGELLESLNMPFIVKGRHEVHHPSWLQVDFDHEWMMERCVRHVVAHGHHRLAYLGFPHDEAFVHALRRGYVAAHEQVLDRSPDVRFFAEHEDLVGPNEAAVQDWLALPVDEQPTAFVIGAGNNAWLALETCLAQSGRRLGYEPGDAAAAGVTAFPFTLMFGNALVYQGIELDNMARAVTPGLLHAVLRKQPAEPITRFRPELTSAATLNMFQRGIRFVGSEPPFRQKD